MYIIDDCWNYIKTFLFHDIKIHGKHLKNDKHVKNYNNIVKIFSFLIKKYMDLELYIIVLKKVQEL